MKIPGQEKPFIFWKTDGEKEAERKAKEEELAARGPDGREEWAARVNEGLGIGPYADPLKRIRPEDVEIPERFLDRDHVGNIISRPIKMNETTRDVIIAEIERLNAIYTDPGRPMSERNRANRQVQMIFEQAGYVGEIGGSAMIEGGEENVYDPGNTPEGSLAGAFDRAESPKGVFYRKGDWRTGMNQGGGK